MMVLRFYVSFLPVILAGIANSIFVKTRAFDHLAKPLDRDRKFLDNRPIFGSSKTYKGFLGYVVLTMLFMLIWGFLCSTIPWLQENNYFYQSNENSILFNLSVGFLLGFAWALFELPNSFLKRRLDIQPSKSYGGFKGIFFIVLDQADSIFGVALVLVLFYPLSVAQYFVFVAIGALTHLFFNFLLYLLKIRKRPV